jgi:hypothetical protein
MQIILLDKLAIDLLTKDSEGQEVRNTVPKGYVNNLEFS